MANEGLHRSIFMVQVLCQAVGMAKVYEALGVTWLEEPVSSAHLVARSVPTRLAR